MHSSRLYHVVLHKLAVIRLSGGTLKGREHGHERAACRQEKRATYRREALVAKGSSFDVVSQVDMNEVRNAVQMAQREIATRFDFKKSASSITLEEDGIVLLSDDEGKLKSVVEVLKEKLVRRKVPLKALQYDKIEAAQGGTVRQSVALTTGISDEKAKAINKLIRKKFKKVKVIIQGDSLRVSSSSKDELQAVMALLREEDFGQPLQFTNYR
jgi:cyclic-di-GMP-binding protein